MSAFSQPERRGLQRMQTINPESHPDADLLTAFAEHSLATREHNQVLAHLAVCASCREVIALAGSPLVEPVPEPARKRGLWEMPLFHWGAVAATTVVVVAAVSLGIREHRNQTLYKEQAPIAVEQKDGKVVAEPTAGAETSAALEANTPAAPATSAAAPKRSLHLQQQARYERPANETKKQEVDAGTNGRSIHGITSGAVFADSRDQLDSANSNAVLKNKTADANAAGAVAPPPPPALAQNAPAGGATEMVTVESGNSEVKTDQSASASYQITPQAVVTEKIQGRSTEPLRKAAVAKVAGNSWQISNGKLQHLVPSSGWQSVLPSQTFRTFATVQNHVWAGGDNGLLYHSADDGQTWKSISVKDGTKSLTGNITGLSFSDAQHGSVQTSTGETWSTSDGGQSWQKK